MSRLPAQPGERIDRSTSVGFTFDGKRVEALEGDTIASALFVQGQRTFSRSFKYHRRRGLLCCAGQCPNCLVAVDGAPGVRACGLPLSSHVARCKPPPVCESVSPSGNTLAEKATYQAPPCPIS